MSTIQPVPEDDRLAIIELWREIYGTNGRGILKFLKELKSSVDKAREDIRNYYEMVDDLFDKFLEDQAKSKKERLWRVVGVVTTLFALLCGASGWAAFIFK